MDKELKSRWVSALRSGEFEQASGSLRTSDGGMCCMGVLGHIQGAPLKSWNGKELETSTLPNIYMDMAELDGDIARALAYMNDAGDSFAQIADWIEKNL